MLPEEHVIREALNDFRDDHKPFLYSIVVLWYFRIDQCRCDDSGGDESEEHVSPKGGELRVRPDFVPVET